MSTNMDALANAFFGDTTPTAALAPAPAQRTADDVLADTLFGQLKRLPAQAQPQPATSEEQAAAVMFKDSPIHGDAERAIAQAAREQNLASDDDALAAAQSWVPTMQSFDLNATESSTITDLAISATVSPPSEETVSAWHQDSMSVLRQEYGNEAGAVLQATQRMLARDPAVVELLERTGLGNHPHVVRLAAAKAQALRKAGKL